ncbi:MAG TPA: DUF2231 domain-containing protein [Propionibacteriaceae bacterium]|nr:DUF2231 domain-containing protein [Propionibacteriaceae bacterium]
MLDLFNGLPVHVLVLHAFVVLGPIAALTSLVFVLRPGWRRLLVWPTLVLAVVAAASGLATKASGEELMERVLGVPDVDPVQAQLVTRHAQLGDVAGVTGLVFGLVVLVSTWFVLRPSQGRRAERGPEREPRLQSVTTKAVASTLVVLVSLALVTTVTLAGHSGATAAWKIQIAESQE